MLGAGIAAVFGEAIRKNFDVEQWEDPLFFRYQRRYIASLADAFEHGSYWRGLYRPLSTNLYYFVGDALFDHDLRVYHSLAVALYFVNTLLAYWVCRSFLSFRPALAVSLLFATRAANTETLLYTTQMQTLLPATFALLALKAYLSALARDNEPKRFALAALCVLLALSSKESMVAQPVLLLVLAFARPPRGALPRGRVALAWLPFVSLGLWYALAHDNLRVRDNPNWTYVFRPTELAANAVAYATSFSNAVVHPVRPRLPAVMLNDCATINAARSSPALSASMLVIAALGALVLILARYGRGRWRPSNEVFRVGVGAAMFFCWLAPMLVLNDRLLMYYGYMGHFGLSFATVAGAQWLARRLSPARRLLRHGLLCRAHQGARPSRLAP